MRIRNLVLTTAIWLACGSPVSSDTIAYTYDDAGRLVRADYGGGKIISYTYDKSGNLLRRTVTTEPAAAPQSTDRKKASATRLKKSVRKESK